MGGWEGVTGNSVDCGAKFALEGRYKISRMGTLNDMFFLLLRFETPSKADSRSGIMESLAGEVRPLGIKTTPRRTRFLPHQHSQARESPSCSGNTKILR
jgi:hypothetical protein